MVISIIYWLLVISSAGYFLVMFSITIGWFRIKRFNGSVTMPIIPVSIIIAVRNEERNILELLKCIALQDYPHSNYEVVFVDDHSEDGTRKIIEDFIFLNNSIKIRILNADNLGKKKAIAQGIKNSSGQLIVTTDGDCTMSAKWLSRLVAFYQTSKSSVIIGPVIYNYSTRLLDKIFSLEFISLVASGAGSAGIGLPFMGNGANLAFSRDLVDGMKSNDGEHFASGEDVFLIQQAVKTKGASHIQFIRDPEATVYTSSPESITAFFNQRIRWASKAKGYKSAWARLVAFIVFSFNIMLVLASIMGFMEAWMIVVFGLFVVLKLLIDIPLLYEFTGFVNRRKLMFLLPTMEFIYPFYILISGIVSLFFRFEWKGRKGLR